MDDLLYRKLLFKIIGPPLKRLFVFLFLTEKGQKGLSSAIKAAPNVLMTLFKLILLGFGICVAIFLLSVIFALIVPIALVTIIAFLRLLGKGISLEGMHYISKRGLTLLPSIFLLASAFYNLGKLDFFTAALCSSLAVAFFVFCPFQGSTNQTNPSGLSLKTIRLEKDEPVRLEAHPTPLALPGEGP